MTQRRTSFILVLAISIASTVAVADDVVDQKQYELAVAKAISYLEVKGQASDGSFSSHAGIGPTALVTTALLRHGVPASDANVAKSLRYLKTFIQADGGIYRPGTFYRNYETCLTILCFTEANKDGRYDKTIKRADAFVKGIQWDEDEDKDPSDLVYGGGYGKHKRPDLSNTSFLIDALRAAGRGQRCGRRCDSACVDFRIPLPEPRNRAQHDTLPGEESRRRLLLHVCCRWEQSSRRNCKRRTT